jgi:hypothetical protein
MSWRNYGNWGIAAALMITFTVSGIWHGASWGFVFWGILHGTYLALSVFYRNTQKKLHKYIGISNKSIWLKICQCFITFNLVSVGWIFFRARSIDESLYLIKSIIYYVPVIICNTSLHDILAGKLNLSIGYGLYELSVAILVIVFILIHDIYVKQRLYNFKLINRWIYYYAIISIIMFLSVTNTKRDFIYLYF